MTVLVVAGSELVAARIEAMLRSEPGLRVAVSGLAQLAHRLEDERPAVVVLALASPDLVRTLDQLRRFPSQPAVVLLSSDPRAAWTAQARRAGIRAVLGSDATAEEFRATRPNSTSRRSSQSWEQEAAPRRSHSACGRG